MSSKKWNATLFGLVLILSTSAAHGQQVSNLAGPVPTVTERTSRFTAACSQRDLLVTTLIEKHGEDRDISGEKLLEVFFAVMDARMACVRGREREAMALYDSLLRISVPAHATR